MNMEELIDQLSEMLDKGMRLPGGKAVLDVEKLRAVIDDLSLNMPQQFENFNLHKTYKYSKIAFTVYRREGADL